MRENEYCLLEIPKGTAELGLRVTAVPEMKGVSENASTLYVAVHTIMYHYTVKVCMNEFIVCLIKFIHVLLSASYF